jgi:hypothetical protein
MTMTVKSVVLNSEKDRSASSLIRDTITEPLANSEMARPKIRRVFCRWNESEGWPAINYVVRSINQFHPTLLLTA